MEAQARRAFSVRLTELIAGRGAEPSAPWSGPVPRGALVGRFEIVREIGRGGFGVVYEALDRELGRKVAIKLLKTVDRRLDPAARKRLHEEAEAVAGLEHPAIVTLFDAGTCPSGPYLVFELLRGEALDVRLHRGRLKPGEALRIAIDVAKALAHAHGRGILHRDLKPANVFLTEDERVKLLDFGLAHLLGGEEQERGGTPAYMAPEQARGEPVDARADVFAFGVMMHEALSGSLPFRVRDGRSAVLDGETPAPIPVRLPKAVVSFIERCLSENRARRPGSGEALLEELLGFERAAKAHTSAPRASAAAGRPEATTASLAKIARPRLPPVFARAGLFGRLDEARSRPVIWVQGPPGAGKTTLIASYLEARKLRTLWYQADEADSEVGTFFHYLRAAAQKAAPRKGPLPPFTAGHLRNLPAFARLWFRQLYAQFTAPFAIVLDNLQTVGVDSASYVVIRTALEELPEGANAILISRTDPGPALARLRAAGAMVIVPGSELRLSPSESQGIAGVRAAGRRTAGEIDRLHERIEGWAAGLVLLLESARTEAPGSTRKEGSQAIFDYFAGEILERADAATQQSLLETALLSRFTARMAERLTGIARAGEILADLAHRGYFTTSSGEEEAHYQFHPLFREFLQARCEKSRSADRLRQLRLEAARVLRDAGDAEEAVTLYRRAEAWDELVDLVLQEARGLLRSGRAETMERWVASVPKEVRDRSPWLVHWLALARLTFDAPTSHRLFEQSYESHLEAGDVGGAYLCFAAEAGYSVVDVWAEAADLARVDQWLERFEQLRVRFPAGPSPDVKARAKLALLAGLLLRRPQHPEYRRWHERAFRFAQGDAVLAAIPQNGWVGGGYMDDLLGVRIGGGAALGYSLLLRGELAESATLLATVGPLARQGGGTPFVLAAWLTAKAMMYSAIGDHEAAIATVREFRALCDTFALHRMEVIVDFQEAFAWIVGENAAGASAALERVSASLRPALHRDQMVFDFTSGLLALRTQAFGRAREHASALVASGERTGMRAFVVFGHLLAARAAENEGDAASLRSSLLAARETGAAANLAIAEYVASLVETRLALRAHDRASAIEWLRRAFALGRDRGFVHHFWFSRAETAELCALAFENAIEPDYARRLVARAVAAVAAGEPAVATGVA